MIPEGYEFQSDAAREGEARGHADAILRVLAARDLKVTDEQRERITTCRDLDTLRTWVTRAVTIVSTDKLLSSDE